MEFNYEEFKEIFYDEHREIGIENSRLEDEFNLIDSREEQIRVFSEHKIRIESLIKRSLKLKEQTEEALSYSYSLLEPDEFVRDSEIKLDSVNRILWELRRKLYYVESKLPKKVF
jgi:hypothetical protein